VEEPAVGLVEFACAVGLGEEGVEAEEDAGDAEGDGVVEDLAEGCGGDGEGWVRHVPDHDRVDDAHCHPANLGEDKGESQGEDRSDLVSDGHGHLVFGRREVSAVAVRVCEYPLGIYMCQSIQSTIVSLVLRCALRVHCRALPAHSFLICV
jgi:hypothetical protein